MTAIDRNARMQAQLIADLLDMNRIMAGKMRLDVERVDLSLVIEAALDTVRFTADAKGITLCSEHASNDTTPGILLNGDLARLQQVIWNLLANAVKFTPAGGHVRVALRRAGNHVEIAVSDNGRGIEPRFLPHVFERFRQADTLVTEQRRRPRSDPRTPFKRAAARRRINAT